MARSIVNVKETISQEDLKTRYETMLNNVANMLDKDGPIYSTWIYFQIGLDDDNYIKFDTSSQDKMQNLIASLSIEKSCSGVANTFTLVVNYDPFNMGQESKDAVEKLDEFIAKAMSEDFDNPTTSCRGRIQYGYNSTSTTSDADLVSPLYVFFLTNATSSVNFDSGISTYTFTGTSTLSADCDYVTSYDKVENENLLEVVGKTLYKYYGDPEHPPKHPKVDGITPISTDIKYRIDISAQDISDAVTISVDKTSATQSPWAYCKKLLDANPLTQKEKDSEEFANLDEISLNKRPRYNMYITDVDNCPTIHITHCAPSSKIVDGKEVVAEIGNTKINYVFSWGMKNENLKNKNIVTGWRPEVDLYTYLMRKANHSRFEKIKELYEKDPDTYKETYERLATSFSSDLVEMYNAELELIGIPADPPMSAEIEVVPRVLENVSRTAGIYVITGASDEITNTGIFSSTLKLFRVRSRGIDASGLTTNTTTMNNVEETKLEKVYTDLYNYKYVTPEEKKEIQQNSYNRTVQKPDYSKLNIKLVQ